MASVTKFYNDDYKNKIKRENDVARSKKQSAKKQNKYEIKQSTDLTNSQINQATNIANKQIIAGENSFDSAYADNAVMREINERQIRTSMANSGMSDSGLNRTQLTAVELQKANADNEVTMQKNQFVNSIRSQLQSTINSLNLANQQNINNINAQTRATISEIENQRISNNKDIRNSFDDNKNAKTEEIISTLQSISDPTQSAAYIKAMSAQYGIDAYSLASQSGVISVNGYKKYEQNANYFKNNEEYKALHSTLAGIDTSNASGCTVAAKQIKSWHNLHKSATNSQIKKLCQSAGINYGDYLKFLKDGNYFVDKFAKKEAKKAKSSSSSGGGGSNGSSGGNGIVYYEEADADDGKKGDEEKGDKDKKGSDKNSGFKGSTYEEAVKYLKDNGVDTGKLKSMLVTKREFARGYAEFDDYENYSDYLIDFCNYAIQQKNNGYK